MKKRILSGMRPTGKLHLGHYLGVLASYVKLQDEYDCYFMVADMHALTTGWGRDWTRRNLPSSASPTCRSMPICSRSWR